jgi:hypothetical protein
MAELEALFKDPDDNVFYFERIEVEEDECVTVVFHFSFNRNFFFKSSLLLDAQWSRDQVDCVQIRRVLFCIGMSVLPWFWFGYGAWIFTLSVVCLQASPI